MAALEQDAPADWRKRKQKQARQTRKQVRRCSRRVGDGQDCDRRRDDDVMMTLLLEFASSRADAVLLGESLNWWRWIVGVSSWFTGSLLS